MVEGICLVATPALIRDFSPQVGRATAMGFWTSGPVLGSLIVQPWNWCFPRPIQTGEILRLTYISSLPKPLFALPRTAPDVTCQ